MAICQVLYIRVIILAAEGAGLMKRLEESIVTSLLNSCDDLSTSQARDALKLIITKKLQKPKLMGSTHCCNCKSAKNLLCKINTKGD